MTGQGYGAMPQVMRRLSETPMIESVWNALLLLLRLFVILSIFTVVGVAFAAVYAWWNGADPWAAWMTAFWAVVIAGFAWYWLMW